VEWAFPQGSVAGTGEEAGGVCGGDGAVSAAWAAGEADAHSYNVMQKAAYLGVIFVLFPLVIWTGLALSPSLTRRFRSGECAGWEAECADAAFLCVVALVFSGGACGMVVMAGFWSRTKR